ncbi:MAG TPA: catalase family protein [Verrucomicrobiae bacterium]|nr:catalase family protein [Verrucomicrobiae bacterium]
MISNDKEEALCSEIRREILLKLEQLYPTGGMFVRRDAHPKTHGVVRAEFRVNSDVPQEMRHGIFASPKTYQAWVRFSAGSPGIQSDRRPDIRGMAVKLMNVPGHKLIQQESLATTQDFLMANNPVYFIRNLTDYSSFAASVRKGRLMSFFLNGMPWHWRLRELWLLAMATLHNVNNPLTIQYWSQTPYQLGPHRIKFSVKPHDMGLTRVPTNSPNYLQEAMTDLLQTKAVTFDFLVQLQVDKKTMPIEDATIRWDEKKSPFLKVASIYIPQQFFTSNEQMMFAENLSFTPWHSLPDHRPLGGINRARLTVYEAVSKMRHERNGFVREEPTSWTLPS